jgi:hypothetical protein
MIENTYLLSVNFNVCHIVLKYSWDVNFRELVLAEDNQEASLTTSTITHNDQFLPDGSHPCPEFCKRDSKMSVAWYLTIDSKICKKYTDDETGSGTKLNLIL